MYHIYDNINIDPEFNCKNKIEKTPRQYCCSCSELKEKMNYKLVIDNALFRNDPDFVMFCTQMNEPTINIINCLTPIFVTIANMSRGAVSGAIIRMINSGDYQAAADTYGISIKSGENIVLGIRNNIMQRIQRENIDIAIEQKQIVFYKDELTASNDTEVKKIVRAHITNATNRIKTKENRIITLKERLDILTKSIREVKNETCGICIDTMNAPTMTPCCNVMFCCKCIHQWLIKYRKKSCPHCRADLNVTQLDTIIDDDITEIKPIQFSKEDSIEKLFKDVFHNTSKILIFTERDSTINSIEKIFNRINVKYISYRKKRSGFTNIIKYTEGDVQVVLLNSVSHGAGLNLQNTTDVILYHKMSRDLEIQAIGRAQRPGRTQNLNIWRLAYKGEYEA